MIKKIMVMVMAACLWSSVTQAAISETLKEKYNEAYLSMIAAAASVENYLNVTEPGGDFLSLWGWKMANYSFAEKKSQTHFVFGSRSVAGGRKIYLLSFRGTAELKDWRINLRAGHSNYGGHTLEEMQELTQSPYKKGQPAVHRGFSLYVEQILRNFVLKGDGVTLTQLFQEIRDNPNVKLLITGHSLGGAAAALLGQRLYDLGIGADQFQVITFGAPAVGNAAFTAQYGNRIKLLRYTSTADPVPGSVQTFFNDYKHFGCEHKFHVSLMISDNQHSSALYLDNAFLNCYQLRREVEQVLGMPLRQWVRKSGAAPMVNVQVVLGENVAKYPHMGALGQYLLDMYAGALPSYRLDSEGGRAAREHQLCCQLSIRQDRREKAWYIDMEQSLYGPQREVLSIASFSKRVTSSSGNVKTLALNWLEARAELSKHLNLQESDSLNLLE